MFRFAMDIQSDCISFAFMTIKGKQLFKVAQNSFQQLDFDGSL